MLYIRGFRGFNNNNNNALFAAALVCLGYRPVIDTERQMHTSDNNMLPRPRHIYRWRGARVPLLNILRRT